MTDFLQVSTTCASREEAERIAQVLLEERLAACAQVQGPITSHYRWHGRMETSEEWLCTLKTSAGRYPELERVIHQLHSYDVPEIIALPIHLGDRAYLEWITRETRTPDPGVTS